MKDRRKGAYLGRIYTMHAWDFFLGLASAELFISNGPTAAVIACSAEYRPEQMGNHSLDTAFDVIESLVYSSAQVPAGRPLFSPESALLCYLVRRPSLKQRVIGWSRKSRHRWYSAPLHWDVAPPHALTE